MSINSTDEQSEEGAHNTCPPGGYVHNSSSRKRASTQHSVQRISAVLLRTLAAALLLSLYATTGCAESEGPGEVETADIEILTLNHPVPVVEGTPLRVTVRGLSANGGERRLEVASTAGTWTLESDGMDESGALLFPVTAELISGLGTGDVAVELSVLEGEQQGIVYPTVLPLADTLEVSLGEGLSGSYFRDDQAIVSGSGFIAPGEGEATARFVGDFTPDGGNSVSVDAEVPVSLAEPNSRDRAQILLTTDIGGIQPGSFTGTVQISQTLLSGASSTSAEQTVNITFGKPTLFDYSPSDPYMGQVVSVRGGGFLGRNEASDEATILEFEGELTLPDGSTESFGPREAVVSYVTGQEVRFGIATEADGTTLKSEFFGVDRCTFAGNVTPIVIKGQDEVRGDPTPVQVELRGMQQIVVVRFLPGFFDSLRLFGLSSAADEVVDQVYERMRGIYSDYNVVILSEPPDDFLDGAIATLEIGGPDPNGLGLFGYDNTPGKDIGNVRLGDSIGGANAETQADNYPGYGGVFIESFLFWSEEPGLPSPTGATPEPDPLFDEVFNPVRDEPATLSEATQPATDERTRQVQRAITVLGSIIGETASHELGHSLGLAQPFGSADAFHSAFPGDGCLMDSGAFRELGERSAQPGFPETRFCNDAPQYLSTILPK